MKLASFRRDGKETFGAVVDGGLVDLGPHLPACPDLGAVLKAGALVKLGSVVRGKRPDYAFDEVEFLPTLTRPEKIVCIGVNYADRNAEYKDGSSQPKYPSVFMRARESLTGHRQPLVKPLESDQLDYEGEIALIIGREGRRIPEQQAHEHIAGLTLMNEGSVRDWLRHAKFNVTQGKNFEQSGSLGPWLVTVDELDPMGELRLRTVVNGEVRQDDTTANLMFPFRYLIHYLSTFYRLQPGDVIATGTPGGSGARLEPPRYLTAGDTVEVTVEEIGTLCNTVVAEAAVS
ncbi:MAG TPA: fumarylacetoacetate hydrolase family protein [Woeseiaceae bacterium]|nr:fumarylacetoacetate hydrolase family protein [Woeseiaceae bacterium]